MGLKYLLLFTLLLVSINCGGAGTAVLNPPSPSESPKLQFKSTTYNVELDISDQWSWIAYDSTHPAGPESFQDIDPQTASVASFFKNQSHITLFYSVLKNDESLLDFVRLRRPSGPVRFEVIDRAGQKINIAFFDQVESGSNGGLVFDSYVEIASEIYWLRAELFGTPNQMTQTLEEYFEIAKSIRKLN